MKQSEREVFAKLIRHMQKLQRQIAKPTNDDATDEEVITLFDILWEWTPNPRYSLPSKTTIENLVALMRGIEDKGYCYISREDVARIIRQESKKRIERPLFVILNAGADKMSDTELYDSGKWNYRESPFVTMLWDLYHKQCDFSNL